MNKQLFESLDRIDDALLNIDVKVKAIHEKLDELIKALHDYDDDQLHCEYSGLPSVKAYDEPKGGPCSKHDEASWNEERMNIIGQNGNEGTHYTDVDENEFDDYGKRVEGKDKNKSNNPAKHTGGKKKSAYDKHMKYPPHKH